MTISRQPLREHEHTTARWRCDTRFMKRRAARVCLPTYNAASKTTRLLAAPYGDITQKNEMAMARCYYAVIMRYVIICGTVLRTSVTYTLFMRRCVRVAPLVRGYARCRVSHDDNGRQRVSRYGAGVDDNHNFNTNDMNIEGIMNKIQTITQ